MYKRFGLNELKTIQNNFLGNFFKIIKKEKVLSLNELLKKVFKEGDNIYYFERGEPIFRISQIEEDLIFIDEKERIEIKINQNQKSEFNDLLKLFLTKKNKNGGQKSIETILLDEFREGNFFKILDKPYLVYDIETTSNIENLKDTKFLIGYSMEAQENNTMKYEYIDQDNLSKFVKKMLDFDGYIVGYNNIGFDNPVCIYNLGLGAEELEIINKKSIDIFMFIWNITGKRIGLNKVAEGLVGNKKTINSGLEAEKLWKQYEETGDKNFLEEFKKYCKNDVRITALVLLYLLHYKKVFIEGDEVFFNIKELINKSQIRGENISTTNSNQSIFEK